MGVGRRLRVCVECESKRTAAMAMKKEGQGCLFLGLQQEAIGPMSIWLSVRGQPVWDRGNPVDAKASSLVSCTLGILKHPHWISY